MILKMQHLLRYGLILAGICLAGVLPAQAQQPAPQKTGTVIEIIQADVLNNITKDTVQLTKFIGNAIFKQGNTLFYCDSAFKNGLTNQVDAYGHVHINQADSINIYGNYLHYDGNSRHATLRGDARLTDGKVTITGPELQYDMNAKIGTYDQTGKLHNGSTVLTSQEGYYYADTKEMYFKKNVLLVDPEYTLTTDTLLYNTATKIATIVAPTTINDGKTIMYATSGFYDTEQGQGSFGNRPTIEDSTATITADNIIMDKKTGLAYATGNMVYRDTTRKMSLLANQGTVNQTAKTILATQKPLMILERNKDTLYVAADTLFSGVIKPNDSITVITNTPKKVVPQKPGVISAVPTQDTLHKALKDSLTRHVTDTLTSLRKDSSSAPIVHKIDSMAAKVKAMVPLPSIQTTTIQVPQQTKILPPTLINKTDTLGKPDTLMHADSLLHAMTVKKDTAAAAPKDTTEKRYILAYHNVKIFSDSLQGVADSVYYSTRDSLFRLFRNPVLWANGNQLTGDTILLYTKNQAADKIVLNQNAFIINQAGPDMYNQIKGNIITGYFKGETLDWMHVDGNAESIYYIKDDEGAYISVNKSLSAVINIYFRHGELYQITLVKDPEGTVYPFTQRPKDQMLFENFHWEIKRRPKSKFELMQ
jgi:lipopolysaccharide export system protein LptA